MASESSCFELFLFSDLRFKIKNGMNGRYMDGNMDAKTFYKG